MPNYKITAEFCGAIIAQIIDADDGSDAEAEFAEADWTPIVLSVEEVGDDANGTTLTISVNT